MPVTIPPTRDREDPLAVTVSLEPTRAVLGTLARLEYWWPSVASIRRLKVQVPPAHDCEPAEAGCFAGAVLDGDSVHEGPSEIDHAQREHQDDGQDEGKLDDGLSWRSRLHPHCGRL
jgi:hypothetical protein